MSGQTSTASWKLLQKVINYHWNSLKSNPCHLNQIPQLCVFLENLRYSNLQKIEPNDHVSVNHYFYVILLFCLFGDCHTTCFLLPGKLPEELQKPRVVLLSRYWYRSNRIWRIWVPWKYKRLVMFRYVFYFISTNLWDQEKMLSHSKYWAIPKNIEPQQFWAVPYLVLFTLVFRFSPFLLSFLCPWVSYDPHSVAIYCTGSSHSYWTW